MGFATRLKEAMEARGLSQAELARAININPAAIQYLLSNDAKSSRFTFEMANALEINTNWLATGQGEMLLERDPSQIANIEKIPVPLLSEQDVYALVESNGKIPLTNHQKWVLADKNSGSQVYGLLMKDISMQPVFNKNAVLLFDVTASAKPNEYIVIYIESQNEVLVRKLESESIIKPVNAELYKSFAIEKSDIILGKIVECTNKY